MKPQIQTDVYDDGTIFVFVKNITNDREKIKNQITAVASFVRDVLMSQQVETTKFAIIENVGYNLYIEPIADMHIHDIIIKATVLDNILTIVYGLEI